MRLLVRHDLKHGKQHERDVRFTVNGLRPRYRAGDYRWLSAHCVYQQVEHPFELLGPPVSDVALHIATTDATCVGHLALGDYGPAEAVHPGPDRQFGREGA